MKPQCWYYFLFIYVNKTWFEKSLLGVSLGLETLRNFPTQTLAHRATVFLVPFSFRIERYAGKKRRDSNS